MTRPRDQRAWHYVKPNETTRVPRRLIFLDTESHTDRMIDGHEQRWAIAVACYVATRPDRTPTERWGAYDDPVLMWRDVAQWAGTSGRTVLWTHNLGYDTRIAEAFSILPELGWELTAHNMSGHGCWLVWRKGRATLQMCDSASVFPTTLAQIGKTLGMGKLALPDAGAGGVGLFSRCWQDVTILRAAMLSYLRWIEREDLGNWQATGAGQAWATFRHRFMDRRLLVHDDEQALAAERRAMWTGRCEAYWRGELNYQVVHEWDLELAYGHIARDTAVPVRLLGPMPDGFDWLAVLDSQTTAFLAEVTVKTGLPVVPAAHEGRILWPTGKFHTTLWDVEIRAAIEAGATVTVHRGWLYRKAPALAKWAQWCIDQVRAAGNGEGDWRYLVCKHWLRALVGRFAMTYTEWEEWARAPRHDARAHRVYDATSGESFGVVQVGQTIWREAGQREWSQSMPMVTGYVQAVARVRLWTILSECPPRAALYADTDSVLVTDRHLRAMADVARRHPEWGLRLKRSWQGFSVWGPRQIRTGPAVRIAGVSRSARRTGRREFTGEVWESLAGALNHGRAGRVVLRDRTWHVRGIDRRRDGPELGWTQPFELAEENDNDRSVRAEPGQGDRSGVIGGGQP